MKLILKFLNPAGKLGDTGIDWLNMEPITDYLAIAYKPLPSKVSTTDKSKTPIKDAVSKLWNRLINLSGQTMLANPSGYPMYTGALKFNTTVGDELKVAGAGAATIGIPAALNYAYNYPITTATDLLYGYIGTKLGGKVGNLIGLPIDQLTNNYYVSEGLGYLGNLLGGGFGINAANNFRKRGIETVMRSGGYIVPDFYSIKSVFKSMPIKRKFDILKYILTGHKSGPKGYYNSFAAKNWEGGNIPDGYAVYTGLTNRDFIEGNDLIDAYLYGKPLDPQLATRLPNNTPTPYIDYIARNYPDKNIPIYSISAKPKLEFKEVESAVNPSNWKGYDEFTDTNPFRAFEKVLDVGGHLEQKGLTETGVKAIRGADIWKFNPKDYILNWIKLNALKTGKVPYYIRIGLNEVDKAGTPVITMTPWLRELNDEEWINYWNSFPPFSIN